MKKNRYYLLIIPTALALFFAVFAVILNDQLTVSSATPDDALLTVRALKEAEGAGLEGTPIAQKSVRMTLGEWLSQTGGELGPDAAKFGLTPELPIFVLAIRGDVYWRGPSELPKGRKKRTFDNITIGLDARNGNLMFSNSYLSVAEMPVQPQ